jgi:hypothetical protein
MPPRTAKIKATSTLSDAIMVDLPAADIKAVGNIETNVKRINDHIRIEDPYFLTSAVPAAIRHRQTMYELELERKSNPFEVEEQHLQYNTWKYRNKIEACLVLHGGIEEMRRREEKKQRSMSKSSASLSTSSETTPKVRLSLADYQKRKKEGYKSSPENKPIKGSALAQHLSKDTELAAPSRLQTAPETDTTGNVEPSANGLKPGHKR